MSTSPISAIPSSATTDFVGRSAALAMLLVAMGFALLAGYAPLGVSIVTVFLFAGPHNWFEARYFLTRMPPRWGALRGYFITGIAGVVALTLGFASLPWLARMNHWDREAWNVAIAVWNTALVLWIVALATMRARTNPRRDWSGLLPLAGGLIALAWLWPFAWDLGLVYLHPLVALWFLDRELGRQRSEWQRAYRRMLTIVPICLGLLWWRLADTADLPGIDALSARITHHAGAGILSGVSSRLLVAMHVFLESLHYAVWLLAIPLVTALAAPWRIDRIPLAHRGRFFRNLVAGILLAGAAIVVVFWAGFLTDYPLTRDIYFTVAMLHVLAEVPFLLRLL
ncbi:MAG: hypothetical protein K8U03_12255 [Planctomycetia bacterium]|nr:hypothetical protein [Planctomycetia bacterium]